MLSIHSLSLLPVTFPLFQVSSQSTIRCSVSEFLKLDMKQHIIVSLDLPPLDSHTVFGAVKVQARKAVSAGLILCVRI